MFNTSGWKNSKSGMSGGWEGGKGESKQRGDGGRDGQNRGTEGSDELESGYYDSAERRLGIPALFNRM